MKGKRIAIFGLGRSGLAIGKAALAFGAEPIVFDEKREEELAKRDVLDEARALGLPVELGEGLPWVGTTDKPYKSYRSYSDWAPEIVVVNPAVAKTHLALQDAVQRGLEVISEVEFAYRISKAPIVAITGTNGKSTTTVMTYLCLRAAGVDAVLCGNIFGSGYPEMPLTEAALNSTAEQVLVAEISSFQLEWVNTFRPLAAAITNITPDHLDRYDSFEEYAATKQRIFAYQQETDYAVLGPDVDLPPGTRAQVLRVGEHARVLNDKVVILGEEIPKSELPFNEEHNYTNACMAGLLASSISSISSIKQGLKQFHGLAHRMERLGSRNDIDVINNSMCTNPAAVVSSAKTITGRAHLLIGGVNKELDFTPLREYLQSSPHRVYLFGTDAEDLRRTIQIPDSKLDVYRTMQEAFKAATEQAKPGETIMLAPGCASTDQFRDFRHRGDVFKAIAMEWLNS